MNRKHWWIGITALAVLGAVGFGYIGVETYRTAPPLPSFIDSTGTVVIPRATILRGQQLFQRYALMNYGSIFGDGAGRGPDFTADALHETALAIAHNFYWNAKPVPTLALGRVFSTLQVVPLMMLTLDAWRLRRMPDEARGSTQGAFAHPVAFLYLMGVSFWNFFGAGVLGLIINLPIVNYFEHGTYLTVNHGHAAFMGVYGDLSLAGMLFCVRVPEPPAAIEAHAPWPAPRAEYETL